ncbi:uncharacterized protein LOC128984141 [Macrosteles quadrilineatus]|uniref:uncharacterized protein LOC128984141 n=1 Tax=Macrosteles quadrilineatus TaxID=74068 RepID=UPI0023E1E0BE|nr:uncharacterized protein LOC128984141 [Macrosteles quadrilineatus]
MVLTVAPVALAILLYHLLPGCAHRVTMKFTSGSAFTVRRSNKMWCGTFTDQTIEQSLMRSMKVEGGLTRSRDLSDSVAFRWLQGHTAMAHITEVVEDFCVVKFGTSEQHTDSRESRVQRDNADAKKLLEWMESHDPFPDNNQIISTGIVGDERVNCHRTRELGQEGVERIVGLNFKTVKFKRHDRVNPLSVMHSGIKVHDKVVIIDPTTLYRRMTIAKQSEDELKEFLKYELSPYPTSLFQEGSMRKGTKSKLYGQGLRV